MGVKKPPKTVKREYEYFLDLEKMGSPGRRMDQKAKTDRKTTWQKKPEKVNS